MQKIFSNLADSIGLIGPDHLYKFQAMKPFLANFKKLFLKYNYFKMHLLNKLTLHVSNNPLVYVACEALLAVLLNNKILIKKFQRFLKNIFISDYLKIKSLLP